MTSHEVHKALQDMFPGSKEALEAEAEADAEDYGRSLILPPFIPAPKGDWVFWRRGYKTKAPGGIYPPGAKCSILSDYERSWLTTSRSALACLRPPAELMKFDAVMRLPKFETERVALRALALAFGLIAFRLTFWVFRPFFMWLLTTPTKPGVTVSPLALRASATALGDRSEGLTDFR